LELCGPPGPSHLCSLPCLGVHGKVFGGRGLPSTFEGCPLPPSCACSALLQDTSPYRAGLACFSPVYFVKVQVLWEAEPVVLPWLSGCCGEGVARGLRLLQTSSHSEYSQSSCLGCTVQPFLLLGAPGSGSQGFVFWRLGTWCQYLAPEFNFFFQRFYSFFKIDF
jgi:hypothetical protein